ncbi:MAG: hypothetical protein ABSC19_12750 [Syntrophorhabdales bacterium]
MYIRSTGLGKTLLQCQLAKVEYTDVVPETLKDPENGAREPMRLLMTMQVIAPVTWTVRAFVEPADVRSVALYFLKTPSALFQAARFLLFGGPSPSLTIAKVEGKK